MYKTIASIASLFLLIAAIGGIAFYAHEQGRTLGEGQVQQRWDAARIEAGKRHAAELEQALAKQQTAAESAADIRLKYQELVHERQTLADDYRAADLRNHRLRRAFDACANSVNVLGDAEAAARADAESLNAELARVHDFHVSRYQRADATAGRLNALIDWVRAQ